MTFLRQILPLLFYGIPLAGEPLLSVEPRDLHGVPGEPMQRVLTVEAGSGPLVFPDVRIIGFVGVSGSGQTPVSKELSQASGPAGQISGLRKKIAQL